MNEVIWNDLTKRMKRQDEDWAAVRGKFSLPTAHIAEIAHRAAAILAGDLADGDPQMIASIILTNLVPANEQLTTDFWRSELGRALAALGKAPAVTGSGRVGPSLAAAILGVSRQRISDLQQSGRLRTPQQIAEELEVRRGTA